MKIKRLIYNSAFTLLLCVFALVFFSAISQAQSINQGYPTPVTSNEISGQIPARDIGDARLTSYFYTFNAAQGDVFINVVTKNLNGDIDIFTHDNLRPLTKITIYADASEGETGRVIYLRQPVKLILRIEGRSPNDDAATYRIKFAGSFVPAAAAENQETETPTVKSDNQTDVRVNSVGTIIEVKPKPTPAPKEIIAEVKKSERETKRQSEEKSAVGEIAAETKEAERAAAKAEKEQIAEKEKAAEVQAEIQNEVKPAVVVTDELPKKETPETEIVAETKKDSTEKTEEKSNETIAEKTITEAETTATEKPKKREKPKSVKPLPPAALENIRLIISFKDGTRIERPMNEVLKVGVDRGVLTIISKDGAIGRYSILDVERMTIE